MTQLRTLLLFLVALLVNGCTGLPAGVEPVNNFDVQRYLGKWYEIARLDHSFERGLEQVTAEYTPRADGGIEVRNRGFSSATQQWKEATGKAYFVRGEDDGYLKVSFFGPVYGSYVIFDLDKAGYQYAFVAGYNHDYLWLLSRTPRVDDALIERFTARAAELGFATQNLQWVRQD